MILDGACGAFNPVLLECLRELSDKLRGEMKSISQGGPSRESILESVDQMARSQDLNITERTLRLLERERLKYQFLADMSPDIVFEYTAQPEMITISEGSAAMLDMPTTLFRPSEIPREKRMFSPEDFKSLIEDLRHTVPELPVIERKYQLTIKGERRWCKVIARSMWSSQGGIRFEGAMGKIIDVHDETETIKSLTEQAERDPLTGLLNQSSIRRRVSSLLSQNSGRCYALVMFDLDNFKQTNDRYGHLFGNDVLRFVAEAVRRSIREEDLAARVGGDEFVVFLEYHSRPEALVRRLFDNLTGQEHQGLRFQVSMGAALAPDAGGDYERLFHHADMAMYAAKFGGKNQYRFYEDGMEVMERD
jgi:putative two-component system response regulator